MSGDRSPNRFAKSAFDDHGRHPAVGSNARLLTGVLMTLTRSDVPPAGSPLASDFPEYPYPGARPNFSYALNGNHQLVEIVPAPTFPSGWRRGDTDLDTWLEDQGAEPLSRRLPVLAYGSNANPMKLVTMATTRADLFPWVAFRCRTFGLAAASCTGQRQRDGVHPATLVSSEAVEAEAQVILMCTQAQLQKLDAVEGRQGGFYHLTRLEQGRVLIEGTDAPLEHLLTYVGNPGMDRGPCAGPDGRPVLLERTSNGDSVGTITHSPHATGAPLGEVVIHGHPTPHSWPSRLFVYGSLKPGRERWPLLAPYTDGSAPIAGGMAGSLFDSGHGWPGATTDAGPGVAGVIVTLSPGSIEKALRRTDEIEGIAGGLFRRVRRVVDDRWCWTYLYNGEVQGKSPLTTSW